MINKVYLQLAISKRASITCRDRKKLAQVSNLETSQFRKKLGLP